MKRRNPRKSDSFDFIRVSPTKNSLHGNSTVLRDAQYKYLSNQMHTLINTKHHLELPKIHAMHSNKVKRTEKQLNGQFTILQNKLLLLGYQYRRENDDFKQAKQEKKQKDYLRKKMVAHKDSFIHKKVFATTVLVNFGISEVVLQRRKLYVYVQQGNNSRMVKQVLRKRSPIILVNDKKQANLVWTRFCDYQVSKLISKCYEQKISPNTQYHQSQHEHEQHHYAHEHTGSIKILQQIINSVPLKFSHFDNQRLVVQQFKMHNHFTNHHEISDKKSLFNNLQKYCVKNRLNIFELVPITYQFSSQVAQLNAEITDDGFWFIKPGEDTNRGNGISIASGRNKIKQQVGNLLKIGKTALVQQYIDPLLYRNRKFDIRCYALVIGYRGQLKAYWYKQGYIRTCSKQFNYDITDILAHLTNDAVQKKSTLYGKFQQSNKLSFGDMQSYLKGKDINFKNLCEDMKNLAIHSIKSVQSKLKGEKNQFNFEIFGYDFLIDRKGKVWLIEINTNPCLQFTGSLTSRVIGHMLDNSLKIALDPFLANQAMNTSIKEDYGKVLDDNKYESII